MKKRVIAAAVGALCLAPVTYADTLLGIYAGAQGWNTSTSGGFSESASGTADFDFDSSTNASLYVAFEHFVPLVPNVKVNYLQLDTDGVTNLNASFEFEGNVYEADTSLLTDASIDSADIILYYEIFDNDLVSFDIGINGKYIDGTFYVEDVDTGESGEASFKGIIPMAYSRVEFGLPFTGLGVYAEGSYLAFDDHEVRDIQAAITYSFVENLAIDMTLQLGYRDITVDIEDLDDIYADLGFDGVFAGLEIHF